ncbi:alpha-amylase [Pedobacter sp. N36a]|uniref:alpha-amylase n=1 Tax=Pedobacter sp. N36a TaxID=2767996 RepID=UPI001656C94B|nr:alpha-amylase [Pedobacter sp. N36a]MBC8984794.1 alpha-amylase [Pedobacter sp. N36a]
MDNQTLFQYFHWYYNEADNLWIKAGKEAENLAQMGITGVWFPPAYKANSGPSSVGYDPYDLYDLGEFDQKHTIPTKYGTKEDYQNAIQLLQKNGVNVIADIVFNHKAGGDELEKVMVRSVNPDDRVEFTSESFEIEAWTKFTFKGRNGEYSQFIWDKDCFSGIDWAEDLKETGIYSIQNVYGEGWEDVPSKELGNYDYLMYNDIEFRNPAVREELKRWGEWYVNSCGMKGFRLDAVKHIATDYLIEWLDHMNETFDTSFFVVAENWNIDNVAELEQYLEITKGRMQLFDSLLHHQLFLAGEEKEQYDLSKIFEGTLVQAQPMYAVTFVDNHDSQPLQALESYIDFWFRPLAYALILLREDGIPCVFYTDLYGAKYKDEDKEEDLVEVNLVPLAELPEMMRIRKDLSYGLQRDYLDFPNCIGWTRAGIPEKENSGIAVIMSNAAEGFKAMEMGQENIGKTMIDVLGNRKESITVDQNGWAEFFCNAESVSVWTIV